MDRLDKAAEMRGQLNRLQDQHRETMASQDWPTAIELQAKIGELAKRQNDTLSDWQP